MSEKYTLDLTFHRDALLGLLRAVIAHEGQLTHDDFTRLTRAHPRPDGSGLYSRPQLVEAYRAFAGQDGLPPLDEAVLVKLRRKPMRTMSGVTPVTVLTKPFPCPGECIFCPNDIRMPKSYLVDEPGAQRAEQNSFDPYLQTYTRLLTYQSMAHPTDKIEVIILGGTWSFYPETYQIWFVKRIFDALHDFGRGIDRRAEVWQHIKAQSQFHPDAPKPNVTVQGLTLERTYNQVVQQIYAEELRRSRELAREVARGDVPRSPVDEYATWEELEAAHRENETAACRVVGLVIETRPDHISAEEVLRVRRLGCTKVQIGFQSLNEVVLRKNRRGHTVQKTAEAVALLRRAGFKIHAHWMPNLYGSDPEQDVQDYLKLFNDPRFCPDELKVYPCSLIESAELMQYYEKGLWRPYTHDELLEVLVRAFTHTPEYCRLTRVIRDIPSTDIVVGNQLTNFRQIVDDTMRKRGLRSGDIRAREIRHDRVGIEELKQDIVWYSTSTSEEAFIQYITEDRRIAAFLRLSLPHEPHSPITPELAGCAIIREVHVYGQSLGIGEVREGKAQHAGLGKQLIERAADLAQLRGYARLAVISAIGTREYYRKRGFYEDGLYQVRPLGNSDMLISTAAKDVNA